MNQTEIAQGQELADTWIAPALWVLAAASVLAHVVSIALHLPQVVAGAMLALSLMLFGRLHGRATYGWRGIGGFIAALPGVRMYLENLGFRTGYSCACDC